MCIYIGLTRWRRPRSQQSTRLTTGTTLNYLYTQIYIRICIYIYTHIYICVYICVYIYRVATRWRRLRRPPSTRPTTGTTLNYL